MKGLLQIKWDMKSVNDVIASLNGVNTAVKTGAVTALTTVAKNIMAESKMEVPYDTGTLQSSAYVQAPVVTPYDVSITFGYGGPNDKMNPDSGLMASQYANIVHDVYIHHKSGKPVKHPYGKWKFLWDPFARHINDFMANIANNISYAIDSRKL